MTARLQRPRDGGRDAHAWAERSGRLSWDEVTETPWPARARVVVCNIAPSQWLVRIAMLAGVLLAVSGTLLQPGLVGRPMLALAVVFGIVACLNPQVIVAPLVYLCVAVPWLIQPMAGPSLVLVVTGFALFQVSLALAGTAPPNVAAPWIVARPYVIAGGCLAGAGILVWLGITALVAAAVPGMLVVLVGGLLLVTALAIGIVRAARS